MRNDLRMKETRRWIRTQLPIYFSQNQYMEQSEQYVYKECEALELPLGQIAYLVFFIASCLWSSHHN